MALRWALANISLIAQLSHNSLSYPRGCLENASMEMIRRATENDVARIIAIARAAYLKYVPRMGREPPPMLADFAAEVAAGHVVVIEIARAVGGYLISWPKMEAYFIDNIAVDPARQGLGLGRRLMEYAVREAKRHNLSAIQLYTNATMTENLAMYAHTHLAREGRMTVTIGRRKLLAALGGAAAAWPLAARAQLSVVGSG